jgi:hypothetical protein
MMNVYKKHIKNGRVTGVKSLTMLEEGNPLTNAEKGLKCYHRVKKIKQLIKKIKIYGLRKKSSSCLNSMKSMVLNGNS